MSIMTLVLAIPTKEAIVVASDSRTTNGGSGFYTDNTQKLFVFNHRVVLGVAGDMNLDQAIADRLGSRVNSSTKLTDIISIFADNAVDEHKKHNALRPPEQQVTAEFLLAGYVKSSSEAKPQPRIYHCNWGNAYAPVLWGRTPCASIGNNIYALPYLDHLYTSGLTIEEAQFLAIFATEETSKYINSVGDINLRMIIVTPRGTRIITTPEIERLRQLVHQTDWTPLIPKDQLVPFPTPTTNGKDTKGVSNARTF